MAIRKSMGLLALFLMAVVILSLVAVTPESRADRDNDGNEIPFEEARIFIEYNSSDNDLGFHVFLDGEDWKTLKIINPNGRTIFDVQGKAGYKDLGLTELFFEGAEPSLFDVPLDELLALFPPGEYEFEGMTVEGDEIEGEATLTHAVPAGPDVSDSDDVVGPGNALTIRWDPVTEEATDPAGGVFPDVADCRRRLPGHRRLVSGHPPGHRPALAYERDGSAGIRSIPRVRPARVRGVGDRSRREPDDRDGFLHEVMLGRDLRRILGYT